MNRKKTVFVLVGIVCLLTAVVTVAVAFVSPNVFLTGEPEAKLLAPSTAKTGERVTMYGWPSTGHNLTYIYDFGDGYKVATTLGNAVHKYRQNGTYEMVLTVQDDRGREDEARKTIEVTGEPIPGPEPPVAVLDIPEQVNVGETFTVDGCGSYATGAELVTYEYQIGGGYIRTAVCQTDYSFDEPGAYDVSLTVTDDRGYSDTATKTINVSYPVPPNYYRVTTSVNPSGAGRIMMEPPGSSEGEGVFKEGTNVTLYAQYYEGENYRFDHWSGDIEGTSMKKQITVTGDMHIVANFATAIQHTLSTSVDPLDCGSISLTPSGGTYDEGTVVTVAASPSSGYMFDHWSGDITGTNASVDVTMDSDKSVTARFTSVIADFSYTIDGLTVEFTDRSQDTRGIAITQWSWYLGDGTTSSQQNPVHTYDTDMAGNPVSVSLTATNTQGDTDTVVKYIQLPEVYTLTVDKAGGGEVDIAPDMDEYPNGTEVTLTADPASGYTFDRWTGDVASASYLTSVANNPLTVTMDTDKTITAHFVEDTPDTYTVSVNSDPSNGGTVQKSIDGPYNSGDTVTLTASSEPGYQFTGWSGDASGDSQTTTITMNADKTITANFESGRGLGIPWTVIAAVAGILAVAATAVILSWRRKQ